MNQLKDTKEQKEQFEPIFISNCFAITFLTHIFATSKLKKLTK